MPQNLHAKEEVSDSGNPQKDSTRVVLRTWSVLGLALIVFVSVLIGVTLFIVIWVGNYNNSMFIGIPLVALLATMIAMALYIPVIRRLTKPLQSIDDVLRRVLHGELDARTYMHGDDLVSQIGQSVDGVLENVQQLQNTETHFTSDVVHELRSPLAAAQATLEGMIDGVLAIDKARLLTLNREVIRLSKLINEQLDLTRLETGHTRLKRNKVDLSAMVDDLVTTHQVMAEDAGLTIEYQAAPSVLVMGDANLLGRAVANLLSNAIRYTAAGGHVTVSVGIVDRQACIKVTDTGIGISEENLPQIFSRFWRADSGRSREHGGLGLGLAMVKEIVSRHGGEIKVESTLGSGTSFRICLPLVVLYE